MDMIITINNADEIDCLCCAPVNCPTAATAGGEICLEVLSLEKWLLYIA